MRQSKTTGDNRKRSTKPATPKVRLEPGAQQPTYTPGLVPARVTRSGSGVSIKIISPEPTSLRSIENNADCDLLAPHLVRELMTLIEHGPDVAMARGEPVGRRLEPVLRAYAGTLQGDMERRVAYALADIAWRATTSELSPAQALSEAGRVRRQQRWSSGVGPAVDADDIARAARGSKRGPSTSLKLRAARVYALLAWDSRASVQPVRFDRRGRGSRSTDLARLIDAVAADHELRKNARNKVD